MEKIGAQQKSYSRSALAPKYAENIVLIGKTGTGKSATGNSLVGKHVFDSKLKASSVTKECQTHEAVTVDGHTINVIDTPGLSAQQLSTEIVEYVSLAEGGIHALLLTFSATNPVTEEEEDTLSTLQVLFGNEILDYVIVVFTGADLLEEHGKTVEEFLGRDCHAFVKDVIKKAGNRMVMIDNKTHDEGKKALQVHRLLSLVGEIQRNKGGRPYTNDLHHEAELERQRKHQEELESKKRLEEMVSLIKDQLQPYFQENISEVSKTVEMKLKDAMEGQELSQAEIERQRKQQDELESEKRLEEMVSLIKDQLHASFQVNMNQVSNTVEKKLKDAIEAQEKALTKIFTYFFCFLFFLFLVFFFALT